MAISRSKDYRCVQLFEAVGEYLQQELLMLIYSGGTMYFMMMEQM